MLGINKELVCLEILLFNFFNKYNNNIDILLYMMLCIYYIKVNFCFNNNIVFFIKKIWHQYNQDIRFYKISQIMVNKMK